MAFSGFLKPQLEAIAIRVFADIAPVSAMHRELILFDGRSGEGSREGSGRLLALAGGDDDSLFVQFGEHWFRSDEVEFAHALAEIASKIQDDVIDELGRGWPELSLDGAFGGVLSPGVDDSGEASWFGAGAPVCQVGELSSVLGHLVNW
jgi:hypothetical protein